MLPPSSSRGLIDLADWRLMRQIERLCALREPRIVFELIAELAAETLTRSEVERIVTRFDSAFCTRRPQR